MIQNNSLVHFIGLLMFLAKFSEHDEVNFPEEDALLFWLLIYFQNKCEERNLELINIDGSVSSSNQTRATLTKLAPQKKGGKKNDIKCENQFNS